MFRVASALLCVAAFAAIATAQSSSSSSTTSSTTSDSSFLPATLVALQAMGLPSNCSMRVMNIATDAQTDCIGQGTFFNTFNNMIDTEIMTNAGWGMACSNDCLEDGYELLFNIIDDGYDYCAPSGSALRNVIDSVNLLNVLCATGNDTYCGFIFADVESYFNTEIGSEILDMSTCTAFSEAGSCLGTFTYYFNEIDLDDDEITDMDVQSFITDTQTICNSSDGIDTSANFMGTETLASISSGAMTTSFISLLVATVALFFVVF